LNDRDLPGKRKRVSKSKGGWSTESSGYLDSYGWHLMDNRHLNYEAPLQISTPPFITSVLLTVTARRKKKDGKKLQASQKANTINIPIHTTFSQWVLVAV
jgi:hypothetical protein